MAPIRSATATALSPRPRRSWSARLGREHQDLNVIAIGAGAVGPANAAMIVEQFLTTDYDGGVFDGPLAAIAEYENR